MKHFLASTIMLILSMVASMAKPSETAMNISSIYTVGKIECHDGTTASGGKTYTVPIAVSEELGFSPKIALTYGSQSATGIAGSGWHLSGISSIDATNKTLHYDNKVAPIDLSDIDNSVFQLDGIRLSERENATDGYQLISEQGFTRVRKNVYGGKLQSFDVKYPNGSAAIFICTGPSLAVSPSYYILEMKEHRGYGIFYEYIHSGNTNFISNIYYGGKTKQDCIGRIAFTYEDITDYAKQYIGGVALSPSKLLKRIESTVKVSGIETLLREYRLKHDNVANEHFLREIDSRHYGGGQLSPLKFDYAHAVADSVDFELESVKEMFSTSIKLYSSTLLRGKFIEGSFSDGLIVYNSFNPNKYNEKGGGIGSDANTNEWVRVFPGLVNLHEALSFRIDPGTKYIVPLDHDGDGTDEIFSIQEYIRTDSDTKEIAIVIRSIKDGKLKQIKSFTKQFDRQTYPTAFLQGDFDGDGNHEAILVDCTYYTNDSNGNLKTAENSSFHFIDPFAGSISTLRSDLDINIDHAHRMFAIDSDGDGKTEICMIEESGTSIYSVSTTGGIKKIRQSEYPKSSDINNDKYFLCDANADGKIDIMCPPKRSQINRTLTCSTPLWAPRECPSCKVEIPIIYHETRNCKKCDKDLFEYVYNNGAFCIECGCDMECIDYNDTNGGFECHYHGRQYITKTFELKDIINGENWSIYLATGAGFEKQEWKAFAWDDDKLHVMDINNDGCADILQKLGKQVKVLINENGKLRHCGDWSISESSRIIAPNLYNLGISHVMVAKDINAYYFKYGINAGMRRLVTSMTDSHGFVSENKYEPLSAGNCYSHELPDNIADRPVIAPVNLLSSCRKTVGSNEVHNFTFKYHGAKLNRKGLGFRGFNRITSTEHVTGRTTDTKYADIDKPRIIDKHDALEEFAYTGVGSNEDFRISHKKIKSKVDGTVANTAFSYDKYGFTSSEILTFDGYDGSIEKRASLRHNDMGGQYHLCLPYVISTTRTRGGESWTNQTVSDFNEMGLPVKQVSYVGTPGSTKKEKEVRYTYDSFGNVLSESVSHHDSGVFTEKRYTYDATGRYMVESTDELGLTTKYSSFNIFGKPRSITDFRGNETRYDYDYLGRLVFTKKPEGIIERKSWEWSGSAYELTETATGQAERRTLFDLFDRVLRTENQRFDGSFQRIGKTYDNRGNMITESLPFKGFLKKYVNKFSYDNYDRPTTITEASGKVTTYSYNGLSVTETKNGITKTTTKDTFGLVTSVEDGGGEITYTYRPDGQPSVVTAPGGVQTRFEYDSYGRRTAIIDPSAGKRRTDYKYADSQLIITETKPGDISIKTTYDKFGRVVKIEHPEFSTSYTYCADGQLESMVSTNGTSKKLYYDKFGRVVTSMEYGTNRAHHMAKTYTYKDGNLTGISYFNNHTLEQVDFEYTNGTKTKTIWNRNTEVFELLEENLFGLPTKVKTGPITRTYAYDPFGVPMARTMGDVQSFAYEFETETGNLLSRRDEKYGLEETFHYDHLNRLVGGSHTAESEYLANGNFSSRSNIGRFEYNSGQKSYQISRIYPEGGNRYRNSRINFSTASFDRPASISFNPWLFQLASATSANTLIPGDTISSMRPPITDLPVDSMRIEDIEKPLKTGTRAVFTYNAAGDRVNMTVTTDGKIVSNRTYLDGGTFAHDSIGDKYMLFVDGDGYSAPAVLVGEGTSKKPKLYFIGRDHLGSITHITDTKGNLVAEYDYEAWGQMQSPTDHTTDGDMPELMLWRGYCGHEWLPWFKVYNMNARLYDPAIGRFLSPDPYVQAPDFSQNFNRYAYALNNPLSYKDEDGEFWHIVIGAAIGGIFNLAINWDNVDSFGDGLAYFGIGAFAGGVGTYVGGVASAFLGETSGLLGGSFIGFASGSSAGAIEGFGNAIVAGGNLGDAFNAGFGGGIKGGASGALLGGAFGFAKAYNSGKNVLYGDRAPWKSVIDNSVVLSKNNNTYTIGEPAPKSTDPNVGTSIQQKLTPYEKGQLGVNRAINEFERDGGVFYQKEVTIELDGVRNRFDFVGKKGDELILFEVKNGPNARFTHNQSINIPKMQSSHSAFTPVGKNALNIKEFDIGVPYTGKYKVIVIWYK